MATATTAPPTGAASAPKAPKELPLPNSHLYQLSDVLTTEGKGIVKKVGRQRSQTRKGRP
jgi:hypothetical protein